MTGRAPGGATTSQPKADDSRSVARAGASLDGEPGDAGPTSVAKGQAETILTLATGAGIAVFQCDGEAYVELPIADHKEVWPVDSKTTRRFLIHLFRQAHQRSPGGEALRTALDALDSEACTRGPERPIYLRVGQLPDGRVAIDLGGPDWQAVIVGPDGWEVGPHPVAFRRTRSMRPLPVPERGGNLDELLRPFVNVASDGDFRLFVAALVAALRPDGPYPLVPLHGEQGSAKTSTARVFRALCDPSASPTRADPREPRDLAIAAVSNWCLVFDNLSAIPPWLSDGLCRLSTGGGFATRALYSDDEEKILDAKRPLIFTSIEEVATRGDLLDRSLPIELRPIAGSERKTEREFWAAFDAAQASLFGALLDLYAAAQRELPGVELAEHPRMADFAELGVAVERAAGWPEGSFIEAYSQSGQDAAQAPLDASPLTPHVVKLASSEQGFTGTATDLLTQLNSLAGEDERRSKPWPKDPRSLSGALRRLAPSLRTAGVEIEFGKPEGKSRHKPIILGHPKVAETAFSAFSVPNGPVSISGEANGRPTTEPQAAFAPASANGSRESERTLGTLENASADGQRSPKSPLSELTHALGNAENAENAVFPSLEGEEEEEDGQRGEPLPVSAFSDGPDGPLPEAEA